MYQLSCGQCPAQHIIQTRRLFSKRLGSHRNAYNTNKLSDSAMAIRCLETHHKFFKDHGTLMRPCLKEQLMNKAEEIETIATCKMINQNVLNDLESVYVTPFIRYYYDFNFQ